MTHRALLIRDNVALIHQGIEVLGAISDSDYVRPEAKVSSSTVGGHFRHCIDYYERLLAAIDGEASGDEPRRVDYDARKRQPELEQERGLAVERLNTLQARIEALRAEPADTPLLVKMDCAVADPESAPWTPSSMGRELQSLLSHTVHHYAIAGVILRLGGYSPPEGFGVAPSTLHYRETLEACAR
jgi:uncharacterized damage-inducible protein DinB